MIKFVRNVLLRTFSLCRDTMSRCVLIRYLQTRGINNINLIYILYQLPPCFKHTHFQSEVDGFLPKPLAGLYHEYSFSIFSARQFQFFLVNPIPSLLMKSSQGHVILFVVFYPSLRFCKSCRVYLVLFVCLHRQCLCSLLTISFVVQASRDKYSQYRCVIFQ